MVPFQLFMLALFAAAPAPQRQPGKESWVADTRCLATETVLFNCPVGHGKVGSLCATSPTPPATVVWRFGTRSNIELTFPPEPRPVSEVFRWSQYTRIAFSIEAVDFTSAGVGYGLVDSSSYEDESDPDGELARWIEVTSADGGVVKTPCRGGTAGLGGMPRLGAQTVEFTH